MIADCGREFLIFRSIEDAKEKVEVWQAREEGRDILGR